VLFALLAIAGCGYHLAGRGGSLPEHIRKIAIPMFKISSFDYNLENVLTYAVIDEIERRGGIKIVDDEASADAVLRGVIKRSDYQTFGESSATDLHIRVYLIISVTLYDQVMKQNYYQDENYTFIGDYYITGDVTSVEANRRQAWEEAGEEFAKRLVGSILEGF
jgi:hypothetical protein